MKKQRALVLDSLARKIPLFQKRVGDLFSVRTSSWQLISIDKSSRSTSDCAVITVTCSIACLLLHDDLTITKADNFELGDDRVDWRMRIGRFEHPPADKWWTICDGGDDSAIAEIVDLVVTRALPTMDSLDDPDALLCLWESGQYPGLNLPPYYERAILLAHSLGYMERRNILIEKYLNACYAGTAHMRASKYAKRFV